MAQYTNQANLNYNGQIIASNIAVGNVVEVVSATKTALNENYTSGGMITYVISITNSGQNEVTNAQASDNLGAYTFGTQTLYPLSYVANSVKMYVNGDLVTSPTVSTVQPLLFTGITIPANGNVLVIYEVNTNEYAPLGSSDSITNTVTISGTGITTPVTASETVTPVSDPDLNINKTITPVPVVEGGIVTYTFTITNSGQSPIVASDNVFVEDTFNPILSNITATINGSTLTPTTDYIYNTTSGEFSTNNGVITVPAATYTQDQTTGAYIVNPGVTTITVSGTI